jgi:hypothetical protein
MAKKLGRPRMGTKPRRVLNASVSAETYQFVKESMRMMPVNQRRPGMTLDLIIQSYRNFLQNNKSI